MTTRYVNTASTAGGDGTTNDTSGANRAYATLAEAETALQATLSENMEILCAGATADARTTFDGWVPGSFRIYIKGNTGDSAGAHAGIWDTGKYRISAASGTLPTLEIVEDNVTVQRIQLQSTHVDGSAIGRFGTVGLAFQAQALVLKGPGTTSASIGASLADTSNTNTKIKDSIAYDWVIGIYVRQESAGAGDSFIVNCTAHSCSQGIRGQDNTSAAAYIQAINNLAFGNTTDWVDTNSGFDQTNSVNNAFGNSGTACPGSSDIDLSTYANGDIFVDAANDDFHLNSSGSAYSLLDNNGVGPSSNSEVSTTDIDGDTRSGTTTSVGADVIVAPASGNAASSSGTGTATGVGSSQATSVANSAASATATATGSASATSVANASGTSTAIATGLATTTGAASSAGTGTAASVGSSANTGVANSTGVAAATSTGESSASSVANAQGTSTATSVGSSVSAGSSDALSSGTSTSTAASAATATAVLTSSGVSTAVAVGSGGEATEKKFGPRGRRIAAQQKKKQEEIERQYIVAQDMADMEVIKAVLSEYLRQAA